MKGTSQGQGEVSQTLVKFVSVAFFIPSGSVLLVARYFISWFFPPMYSHELFCSSRI